MTTSMASSNICDVCRSTAGTCLHCTDLNHAVPLFGAEHHDSDGLHEFQFFSHEDSVAWMFNEPKGIVEDRGAELQPAERLPVGAPAGFKLFEPFGQACETDPAPLSFDVCLDTDRRMGNHRIPVSVEGASAHAASSATIMSFTGTTFTDASSGGSNKDIVDVLAGGQGDPNMDREAKVRRYKEKRTRRKFEKQIRYASRKAYAEMRPRIKGRFAKTSETETETEPRELQTPPDQPPNAFEHNRHGFRWFHT